MMVSMETIDVTDRAEEGMEVRQLKTFCTLVETRSFTKTAEALHYAQSSVTAQIQTLEEEFGVALFDRLGKRVVLTEAGQRLLGYAQQVLHLTEEAHSIVPGGDQPAGTLTIGASETHCTYRLPAVLQRFRGRFPQVELRIRPALCPLNETLRRMMSEGQLDVAFLLKPQTQIEGLVIEPLIREPFQVVAPVDHPFTHLPQITPTDVQGVTLIVTEMLDEKYHSLFESMQIPAGRSRLFSFNSTEAIKQCVLAGMGIGVVPEVAVASAIAQGQLIPLNWVGPELAFVTQVAWHKDKRLTPALQAFLQVTREVLASPSSKSLFGNDRE
jgi:DNA-binding transcriptional LysR family regulator